MTEFNDFDIFKNHEYDALEAEYRRAESQINTLQLNPNNLFELANNLSNLKITQETSNTYLSLLKTHFNFEAQPKKVFFSGLLVPKCFQLSLDAINDLTNAEFFMQNKSAYKSLIATLLQIAKQLMPKNR